MPSPGPQLYFPEAGALARDGPNTPRGISSLLDLLKAWLDQLPSQYTRCVDTLNGYKLRTNMNGIVADLNF
jgi:hypothetical protein